MVLIFLPLALRNSVEGVEYLIEHLNDFDWPKRLRQWCEADDVPKQYAAITHGIGNQVFIGFHSFSDWSG